MGMKLSHYELGITMK